MQFKTPPTRESGDTMSQVMQQVRRTTYLQDEIHISDAHCHLDLFEDPKRTIADAISAGVNLMITSGGSRKGNAATTAIANNGNVFGVVGIDPSSLPTDSAAIDEIVALIKGNQNIVGIGEIGLDAKEFQHTPLDKQAEAFVRQISIANDLDVPIVVHSRGAINEAMAIVEKHCLTRAMFHFFEGTEDDALRMAKLGNIISIPPRESSRRKRVINAIDITNIVTETDAPVAGKTPSDVKGVIEFVASTKKMEFGEVAERVSENIRSFFHI